MDSEEEKFQPQEDVKNVLGASATSSKMLQSSREESKKASGKSKSSTDQDQSDNRDIKSFKEELDENDYEEDWEHEYEDEDISGGHVQKSFIPHQKWKPMRGRGRGRGFTRWVNRGSFRGSVRGRGAPISRKYYQNTSRHLSINNSLEDDPPPPRRLTNLQVKLQNGRRFAKPDGRPLVIDRQNSALRKSREEITSPRFKRARLNEDRFANGRIADDKEWKAESNFEERQMRRSRLEVDMGAAERKTSRRLGFNRDDDSVDCRELLISKKLQRANEEEGDLREKIRRKGSRERLGTAGTSRDFHPGRHDREDKNFHRDEVGPFRSAAPDNWEHDPSERKVSYPSGKNGPSRRTGREQDWQEHSAERARDRGAERARQREVERERGIDREKETNRQIKLEREVEKERQLRERQKEAERELERERERVERERERLERERELERERLRELERERERVERERERLERERQKEMERERERVERERERVRELERQRELDRKRELKAERDRKAAMEMERERHERGRGREREREFERIRDVERPGEMGRLRETERGKEREKERRERRGKEVEKERLLVEERNVFREREREAERVKERELAREKSGRRERNVEEWRERKASPPRPTREGLRDRSPRRPFGRPAEEDWSRNRFSQMGREDDTRRDFGGPSVAQPWKNSKQPPQLVKDWSSTNHPMDSRFSQTAPPPVPGKGHPNNQIGGGIGVAVGGPKEPAKWTGDNGPSLESGFWHRRTAVEHRDYKDRTVDPFGAREIPNQSNDEPNEVIFILGLAPDVTELEIRHDIRDCDLWPSDVRLLVDGSGISQGIMVVKFNSKDEAYSWMSFRKGKLTFRNGNYAPMVYKSASYDWMCVRCDVPNYKNNSTCCTCKRIREECLDGFEESSPYPTNALLLRNINPKTSQGTVISTLKCYMQNVRLERIQIGPRCLCFLELTSVVDALALYTRLIGNALMIDKRQIVVSYARLECLPPMSEVRNEPKPTQYFNMPAPYLNSYGNSMNTYGGPQRTVLPLVNNSNPHGGRPLLERGPLLERPPIIEHGPVINRRPTML